MATDRALLGLLGLAARAGQLLTGADRAAQMARTGQAKLILADEGLSDNTRKKLHDAMQRCMVPCLVINRDSLGRAVGRPEAMAAAMTEGGITQRVLEICQGQITTTLNARRGGQGSNDEG